MKNYFIIILIISAISLLFYSKKQSRKINMLENNQEVLLDSVQHYIVKDSLNAATTEKLQLSINQLEKYRTEDLDIINELRLSKSSLQQYISSSLENKVTITTPVRDSIIYLDTIQKIEAKSFDFKSEWTDVKGIVYDDSIHLEIFNREALIITQSYVKKKLWFIKLPIWLFGYKTEKIDVVSKNPNTKIQSVEFIKITK